MRYLLLIFFLFFVDFVYAQENPSPTCASLGPLQCGNTGLTITATACINNAQLTPGNNWHWESLPVTGCPTGSTQAGRCNSSCTCPEGYSFNVTITNGNKSSGCVPDNPTPSPDCPGGGSKVYDPSTGTMVCPGSGDGSSSAAASSQSCVVPGDFNGDCVPDNEQNSSAAASVPSGSGSSTATSTPTSGGDDDSNTGGGGGSGSGSGSGSGGTPNNPTSSQSSSMPSGSGSGTNNSWTPFSGYGNWIPVSENSNCPNKYKDNTGQWWCSGASGSNSSGAGHCDPTSKDYLACISQADTNTSSGSNSSQCNPDMSNYLECSGKLAESEGKMSQLSDKFKESTDKETEKFKKALDDDLGNFQRDGLSFKNEPSILRSALIAFLPVSRSCNPPPLKIMGKNYELDCEYIELFKSAFGWFLAVLTAWNIWQLAIRPVDR